jgi:hypothetical protein
MGKGMADLVSVSEYKAYANINSNTNDSKINSLRTHVSSLVKTYCGRTFIDNYSSEKTEYFDVEEYQNTIHPAELPITEVVQLLERGSASTNKTTIESNFADANNYYLLESGTAQCTLSSKANETNCINNDTFNGSGLNDLTITGYNANTSSGEIGRSYTIQIDNAGTPDTFKWSRDGGSNWKENNVVITGSIQQLEGNISITFGATTGHTDGESWSFTAERWTGSCSNTTYTTQETCEAASEYWTADRDYELASTDQAVTKLKANFPLGTKSVKLIYKGGYSSTPSDLKLACFDLITYYMKKESTPNKAIPGSASINNIAGSTPSDFPPHIKRILELYRNID